MSEISERYRAVADGFGARLDGVGPDVWSTKTPCEEWTARDLVAHVVGVHRRVLATLDGSEPHAGSSLYDGPVAAAPAAHAFKIATFDTRGRKSRTVTIELS